MHEMVQFLARHGYWLLVGSVLGRQACLSIPANLILVAAGALAHSGKLSLMGYQPDSHGLSGRRPGLVRGRSPVGKQILHFLCGLSRDPEGSVHRATSAFAKRGVKTLLVSKFVVGLDAVAAPLGGASGTRLMHFVVFDALGAMLWSTTYAGVGYVFSDQ